MVFEVTFEKSAEILVTRNECCYFLLFSSLKMDCLRFAVSLLLIVSLTSSTFGSAIKAKNSNGEVKRIYLCQRFVVLFTS